MNTRSLMTDFMKGRDTKEIYNGDTSDAPYVPTMLLEHKKAAEPASATTVSSRCDELFRNNAEFLKRIETEGVTFYDEQHSPVWFTRNVEDVLHALGVTGQRHFGPIVGGSGPRF